MGVLQVIANINEKKKAVPQVPPAFVQSIRTLYHSQQFPVQPASGFPQHSPFTHSQSLTAHSTPSFTQLLPTQPSLTSNQCTQSARQYYQDCGQSSGMSSPMTDPRESSTPLPQDSCTTMMPFCLINHVQSHTTQFSTDRAPQAPLNSAHTHAIPPEARRSTIE
ncbi:unnamed protein product [Acanthoscelides obtectus]|uniref:Uncharacterized protein n=1 Tax=Acanthoscelides obtectus TaxID=200917 RepID=A0A9P0PAP0_ACAOB|nr:unnamed protein product [Acanthoscelides obtectus]CAK1640982.1 hypothetical protein AOBTE_LOCUS12055 [Acanthoscelides obtectus]